MSVPPAIRTCNKAGVDVRMVTGDSRMTAVAIAKQCGILRPGIDVDEKTGELIDEHGRRGTPAAEKKVMTGSDFRKAVLDGEGKIQMDKGDEIWPHLRVLCIFCSFVCFWENQNRLSRS